MRWSLLCLIACGNHSTAPHRAEDAAAAPKVVADAALPPGPYRVDPKPPHGDVQIRVEWKDVPVVARASPGRTACGTAKLAAVAPTTTWGVPEVVVMIEVDHGKELAAEPVRVVLEHCALSPRVAIGAPVIVASAMDAPAQVSFARLGTARPLAVAAKADAKIARLPIVGHEVELASEAGSILAITSAEDEAIVVTPQTPYYAITEANGQVVLRDVPTGTFAISALLPARAGQPAKVATGKVTVTAGALAEVTLTL